MLLKIQYKLTNIEKNLLDTSMFLIMETFCKQDIVTVINSTVIAEKNNILNRINNLLAKHIWSSHHYVNKDFLT